MTPSEVRDLVNEIQRTGQFPRQLTGKSLDEVSKSLASYLTDASKEKLGDFTDKVEQLCKDALNSEQLDTEAKMREGQTVTVGESKATARGKLLDFLHGHAGPQIAETMDLDFFLRIPQEIANGAGVFLSQNWDADRVDEYPALELVRVFDRLVPRGSEKDPAGPENGWDDDEGRWVAACDEAGDDDASEVFEQTGRMVALKSSGVWQALGDGSGGYDDTLGNAFPPFAFNSGMMTNEIARDECIELGLLNEGEAAESADIDLGDILGLNGQRIPALALNFALEALKSAGFEEEEHPRDEHGRFSPVAALAEKHGMVPIHREQVGIDEKTGKPKVEWRHEGGEPLAEHQKALGVPPAWTEAHVNPDKDADLQAVGLDSKGRVQRVYSDTFVQQQADQKFSRNRELLDKQSMVVAQNEKNLDHPSASVRENAAVMKLIHQTGIRPGSEADTGAEKQAYGATTLEGRHVHIDDNDAVRLRFVGKKGVDLDIPVEDKATADMLKERKAAAGDNGKLFDTDSDSLRQYSHTLDGGGFKPKDFRTLKGTTTAMQEIDKNPTQAISMKEYKKRVMDIAKKVSAKLGNTPTIALQSYINPFVFDRIRPAA